MSYYHRTRAAFRTRVNRVLGQSRAALREIDKDDRKMEALEAKDEQASPELPASDTNASIVSATPTTGPAAQSDWPDAARLPDLSEHQREQYARAAHGSLSILGGRPGTGKTYTLARLLAMVPKGRCAVAAPTGKAAVRITESLARAGVANVRATTIHSLLKVTSDGGGDGWEFEYNESNPLPLDWIFVDEVSMCSTSLTAHLLAARMPGCKVMLIGDVNQLAPVEHGAPLRDMIAAGLPTGTLIQIQRNSGRIVKACHAIIDRKTFEPSERLDLEAESPENLLHVERKDPEQQIETLKGMLEKFRGGAKVAGRPVDPVWDTQIIVPVNDKSPLARSKLNTILQGFLNPAGEQHAGQRLRVNDKIVNGKNSWMPAEETIPRDLQSEGPWNEGDFCWLNSRLSFH